MAYSTVAAGPGVIHPVYPNLRESRKVSSNPDVWEWAVKAVPVNAPITAITSPEVEGLSDRIEAIEVAISSGAIGSNTTLSVALGNTNLALVAETEARIAGDTAQAEARSAAITTIATSRNEAIAVEAEARTQAITAVNNAAIQNAQLRESQHNEINEALLMFQDRILDLEQQDSENMRVEWAAANTYKRVKRLIGNRDYAFINLLGNRDTDPLFADDGEWRMDHDGDAIDWLPDVSRYGRRNQLWRLDGSGQTYVQLQPVLTAAARAMNPSTDASEIYYSKN